jgi:hypothetical protein
VIRLDTVRFRLPEDAARVNGSALASHPEARFDYCPRAARPADSVKLSTNDVLGFGLSQIIHDRLAGWVTVEFSAKLLADRYLDGITLNTVETAAAALTRSGYLDVTPAALLGADLTRADPFVNLRRGADLPDDFAALRTLCTHPTWKYTPNGRTPSTSLRWNRGKAGVALRVYDKGDELGKAANRPFLRTLRPETWQGAAGTIRFERQATGNAKARALASVAVHEPFATLGTVLASTRPAVAETFADVRRPLPQHELFDEAERYAEHVKAELGIGDGKRLAGEVYRRFGVEWFAARLNGDADAWRAWLRQHAGPKASELYPEAEAACVAYLAGPEHARRGRVSVRLDTLAALLETAA